VSWTPNLENVPQPIPIKNLLKHAADILIRHHLIGFPQERLEDSHGLYGLRYGHFILLAKDYVYGDIISVHKEAVAIAIKHEVKLLIYLASSNSFYSFRPEDILKNHEGENRKGTARMLNFTIKLGKRFDLPIENVKGYA